MNQASPNHILVIGGNGQLGTEIVRKLEPHFKVTKTQLNGEIALDLSKPETIKEIVLPIEPDLIINCAAYTAVDKAESEPLLAQTINGESPAVLAHCCKELGIRLIHYSTDYVYDGNASSPITEEHPTNPVNEYGRSKLMGDISISESGCDHLIFRTSWVYAAHGHNFLRTMLRLAQEKQQLDIVGDQQGSPTWTGYLADETAKIVSDDLLTNKNKTSGIFNMTNSGSTSWFGFAEAIFDESIKLKLIDHAPKLNSVRTEAYPTAAKRPKYSVLSNRKANEVLGTNVLNWKLGLAKCLKSLKNCYA